MFARARDNPFRVDRVLSFRYRPQAATWEQILSRLRDLQFQAAIVGPEGTGKTTLLEDLQQRLESGGQATRWLQLRRETRRQAGQLVRETLRKASPEEILLVDGAEQIGMLPWRRIRAWSRRSAGVVITSHRPGRLPTLIECATDVNLLRQMVQTLSPDGFSALAPQLPSVYSRHDGNLRLCIRELYDLYAAGT